MSNEHFNWIARFYDQVARFDPDGALLEALALPTTGLLLDAGGGTGRVAAALRPYTGGTVVADVSRGMLEYAHRKGLTCVYAPVERLPFESNSFARVFMLDALHHVAHQAHTLQELYRVLAPGGILLVVEPDIRKWAVKLIALGEKLLLMRSHFLRGDEIAALLPPQARVEVRYVQWNVWVLAQKK